MVQPGQPDDLDETVLDPGRQRWFPLRNQARLAETLLDPGRCRPDGWQPGEWPEEGLPDALAARYELIRPLELPASQGRLFLVRVRADGTEAVLKRRHTTRRLDSGLASYLRRPDPHLVRHFEAGDGYEVMDHLPGRTLRERFATDLSGFGLAELHEIVQQLTAGLTSLHRQGFVHRDVKPANIMLSPTTPEQLTLVDFGIAGPVDGTEWPDKPNLAYQPPEWSNAGLVGEATDWWGLGMTLLELASGEHPFDGLTNEDIRDHFAMARGVDASGVPADRLRNLCLGLLTLDRGVRWNWQQVGRWLNGEDPDLPETVRVRTVPVGPTDIQADRPFSFDGRAYTVRSELAMELANDWNRAAQVLFDHGDIQTLREWLDQFSDSDGVEARAAVDAVAADRSQPARVRLLRVLQALQPTRLSVYRNHIIARRQLIEIATEALKGDGDRASVLSDLWNYQLLPGFDNATPTDPTAGGEDLTEVDLRWRLAYQDWPHLIEQVPDLGARAYLREVEKRDLLAVCLRAAIDRPDDLDRVRQQLHQEVAGLPVRIAWYDKLVADSAMTWVAVLLTGYASGCARTEADRRDRHDREQRQWRSEAAFREWSRQQNRSAALGWAVAGICLMAAGWFLVITVSDLVQSIGDPGITLAWVGSSVCLPVSLVVECLLAAEIGGRFHRRYSIPGAGAKALEPVGRWMRRSPLPALGVIVAASVGIGLLAVSFPLLLVVATTAAQLGWAARRLQAWRAQVRTEEADAAPVDPSRPSANDARLIGAAGGMDS